MASASALAGQPETSEPPMPKLNLPGAKAPLCLLDTARHLHWGEYVKVEAATTTPVLQVSSTEMQALQWYRQAAELVIHSGLQEAKVWQDNSRLLVKDLADYHSMAPKEVVAALHQYKQAHPDQTPHMYRWMCGEYFWQMMVRVAEELAWHHRRSLESGGCHAVSADGKTTLPSVTEKETSVDHGLEDKSSGSPADKASTGVHHLYLADLGTDAGRQQGPHYWLDSAAASLESANKLSAELDCLLAVKQKGPAAEAATLEQRLAVEMCVDVQQDEQAQHAPGKKMQGRWTGWFSVDVIFCLVMLVCGLTCTLGPMLLAPHNPAPISSSVAYMQHHMLPALNESATWTPMAGPLRDAQLQPQVDSDSTLGRPVAVATAAEVTKVDDGLNAAMDLDVQTAVSAQQQAADALAHAVDSQPSSADFAWHESIESVAAAEVDSTAATIAHDVSAVVAVVGAGAAISPTNNLPVPAPVDNPMIAEALEVATAPSAEPAPADLPANSSGLTNLQQQLQQIPSFLAEETTTDAHDVLTPCSATTDTGDTNAEGLVIPASSIHAEVVHTAAAMQPCEGGASDSAQVPSLDSATFTARHPPVETVDTAAVVALATADHTSEPVEAGADQAESGPVAVEDAAVMPQIDSISCEQAAQAAFTHVSLSPIPTDTEIDSSAEKSLRAISQSALENLLLFEDDSRGNHQASCKHILKFTEQLVMTAAPLDSSQLPHVDDLVSQAADELAASCTAVGVAGPLTKAAVTPDDVFHPMVLLGTPGVSLPGGAVEADALSPVMDFARTEHQRVKTLMPVPSTSSLTRISAQAPAKHGSRVAPACTPADQAPVTLQPTPNAALMQSLPPAGWDDVMGGLDWAGQINIWGGHTIIAVASYGVIGVTANHVQLAAPNSKGLCCVLQPHQSVAGAKFGRPWLTCMTTTTWVTCPAIPYARPPISHDDVVTHTPMTVLVYAATGSGSSGPTLWPSSDYDTQAYMCVCPPGMALCLTPAMNENSSTSITLAHAISRLASTSSLIFLSGSTANVQTYALYASCVSEVAPAQTYQGRQNSLAADGTAPISAALYDCSVVTAPADYPESVQHSLQETRQAVADTDAGMHSIHVAQGADLLPGTAPPVVIAGASLIGRLAIITAAQLQLALEASIARSRVLATALVPVTPASSPEVLIHPHIAQRHMQVPADSPTKADAHTVEQLPQAMVPMPSLLHQLAVAAAVKMQLALEASMAERRARETALMPAGGFGHVVTTPVLDDDDKTAESSPEAAANMGPVAQDIRQARRLQAMAGSERVVSSTGSSSPHADPMPNAYHGCTQDMSFPRALSNLQLRSKLEGRMKL